MAQLNQIIAVEKGVKSRNYAAITELNKIAQKAELFNGFHKVYQAHDEENPEKLPSESKRVQYSVRDLLGRYQSSAAEIMEVTARKDWTNCTAKADVTINGKVIIKDAPITYLLFLEKQLADMLAFARNLPTLDPQEEWKIDANTGLYQTSAIQTFRTKKTAKVITLAPATVEHPAQAQLFTEDNVVGNWNTVKTSGTINATEKQIYIDRIELLMDAVKTAREQANMATEVESPKAGEAVLEFVFAQITG